MSEESQRQKLQAATEAIAAVYGVRTDWNEAVV